jgi:hypothetical protein
VEVVVNALDELEVRYFDTKPLAGVEGARISAVIRPRLQIGLQADVKSALLKSATILDEISSVVELSANDVADMVVGNLVIREEADDKVARWDGLLTMVSRTTMTLFFSRLTHIVGTPHHKSRRPVISRILAVIWCDV